jgi:hypothetical protein
MSEENEKSNFELWIKSGLIVGAISIGGYWLGFVYEKGYADYFAIPIQLISLNLISIFRSILELIAVVIGLLVLANVWYAIIIEIKGVIYRRITGFTAPILYCAAALLILGSDSWSHLKWFMPVFAYFLLDTFVFPLVEQRGKGTYSQKLEAAEATWEQNKSKTLFGFAAQKINRRISQGTRIWIIMAIYVLFSFASWIGTAEAQKQKSFWVTREPQSLVVLRIYGDKFICAPFDSKARTVEKTLYILDTPKQDGIWLDWKEVGPLKLVDKKVPDVNK